MHLGRAKFLLGIVFAKLAKFSFKNRDMQKFMEVTLTVAELFAASAKFKLPHPQNYIEYNNYSFAEY